MAQQTTLILGEYMRALDDRFRLTLPPELATMLAEGEEEAACVLAKERPGCLSLWNRQTWEVRIEPGIAVVRQKVQGNWLPTQVAEVQQFARLLSTRSREVSLAGRGRLVVPAESGFREFLGVKPAEECAVVGAGLCIELWHPEVWREYLMQEISSFGSLFEKLSK